MAVSEAESLDLARTGTNSGRTTEPDVYRSFVGLRHESSSDVSFQGCLRLTMQRPSLQSCNEPSMEMTAWPKSATLSGPPSPRSRISTTMSLFYTDSQVARSLNVASATIYSTHLNPLLDLIPKVSSSPRIAGIRFPTHPHAERTRRTPCRRIFLS